MHGMCACMAGRGERDKRGTGSLLIGAAWLAPDDNSCKRSVRW